MKKTIVTLFIVLCAASLALAQTTKATATQAQTTPAHKLFKGAVESVTSVTLADQAKGTKPEIAVINAQKQEMTFLVESTTAISDSAGKPITLDKVQKGENCSVTYDTTAPNVNEAISVHLLKQAPPVKK
jgi:uncharacterized membrane-anchored protein